MNKILALTILFSAASAFGEVKPWASPAETDALVRELQEFLKGAEVRYPGSPGNLAMEGKITNLFADSGLQHGEIKFQAPCFIPGETFLAISNHAPIRIYAMHPTLFRPGNFKEKEFAASLVYLGHGSNDDLEKIRGIPLAGALALMEFSCGTDWMRLLRFGVKGFIFIEPETYERNDALAKVFNTELAVPRFLVSRAEGALLKANAMRGAMVNVKAEPSRWENKMLRDSWVLVPGSDPDLSREVVVLVAPLDSNCIVPEMASGAQAGANLFCLNKLLVDFKRQPPARSILLAAVNARIFANQGERMLVWHMLAGEDEMERLRDTLNNDFHVQRVLLDHYRRLDREDYGKAEEDLLVSWRSLVDQSTGKNITVKNPLVALAKRDVNRLKNEQMILFQQNLPKPETERGTKELEKQREKHVKVLTLFNKIGFRTKLSDLSKEEIQILKGYVREVIQFNSACAQLNERDLVWERQNDVIREVLKGRKVAFIISLALDWSSPQIGFYAGREAKWCQRWGVNTFAVAEQLEEVGGGKANLLADTLTMRSGFGAEYYFFRDQLNLLWTATQTAAFDLLNVFPAEGNTFLPSDTFERLDKANFADEICFLLPYFRVLFSTPHITDPSELDTSKINPGQSPLTAIQVKTFKFDEFSASVVPELPVPNTAVILSKYPGWRQDYKKPLQSDVIFGDVYSSKIMLTDQRAATVFYGLNLSKIRGKGAQGTMAFHYNDDFTAVDHVIDAGEAQKKMSSDDLYTDLTMTLFQCSEFPIYTVADSSLVSGSHIYTGYMIPLTAKGNTSPRKYGLAGVKSMLSRKQVNVLADAPAAFYFSRGEKIKLVTEKKRLALNATENEYEGRGYGSADELGPDFFRNVAGDMSILNHARIRQLRDVANELVHEFAARGDRCLGEMRTALAERNYLQYLRKLYEGLGAQVKSYEQAKQTRDDMLKAIVIYMALLLPFCFFIEKLVFNFVKIEHEMGMFAVLFVATFLVFRQIHPAFRVAQAAEAIFIAFVMGALGLFVISILRSRFEGEMQLLFRNYLSGIMDEAAYSTVTQKAMLIGVNNMKRRRIRTMLTTMTIMLIAFTMLSFTSISKKVNPTIIHKSSTPSYTGFMFQWPGRSQMEEATYAVMRDLFSAHGQVITRRWKVMSAGDMPPFHVSISAGKETAIEAVLGLTAAEDGFLDKFPVVKGRYFSADNAREALISSQMAENLAIDPAKLDRVVVNCGGYDLQVVGTYDDDKIRNLKDLNDIPILPIKETSQRVQNVRDDGQEEIGQLGLLSFVDPLSLLIVPCDIARRMGAFPYSVSVKMKNDAPVWPLMDVILTSTMAKFYLSSLNPFQVGNDDHKTVAAGTYYIGSNYKTSIGGLAVLLIPLFIAGTIIFNTMLGSVYERKKEIAVYNAIGLNPHHIGLFFLAESFVYGVIGSVGGYLIGQLLSMGVNYTGLVKGINFNYSSLSVAYVIIFTIAIVLLSTIYPAMAAVRTAVPSGKRTWSMPAHKGNIIEIVFPFIYQPKIASGVLAYLREYFANFTEVSIGDLIANQLAHGCKKDDKGRECFNLEYHIALVPYDLGVTENLRFYLSYDDYVQAYRLVLKIERVSGQDVNWLTTNRPFLERLRKYLMRWRNLDLGQQTLYVQQSSEAIAVGS